MQLPLAVKLLFWPLRDPTDTRLSVDRFKSRNRNIVESTVVGRAPRILQVFAVDTTASAWT
jgi:hypothetical protein